MSAADKWEACFGGYRQACASCELYQSCNAASDVWKPACITSNVELTDASRHDAMRVCTGILSPHALSDV